MRKKRSYENLHSALIETRRSKGLTQTELARRLGKHQSFVSKYESGERRLDVVEFLEVCHALSVRPAGLLNLIEADDGPQKPSVLERWDVSEQELTYLVDRNPRLRGVLLGYVAEYKFHEIFLNRPEITEKQKSDDHDRSQKGDWRITYKGKRLTIEVKSLQTNHVKELGDDHWMGKVQVDASDSREITFPDGSVLKTTCLLRGEFDVLAINCFAFGDKWRFAFVLNSELPQNNHKKYTEYQRRHLLPTLVTIEWPLKAPFTEDLFGLLDNLVMSQANANPAQQE